MNSLRKKLNIIFIICLLFIISSFTEVYASDTDLDRSSYVDGSQFDNDVIDIPHVKVGLLYDDKATDRVYLDVADGAGFQFLTFNSQRVPRELGSVQSNHIIIIKDNFYSDSELSTKCYHIRLNESFYKYEDARAMADHYPDGFPAYYHGKYCVLFGEFDNINEANDYVRENEIDGHGSTSGKNGILVLNADSQKPLFGFDMSSFKNLSVAPIQYENEPTTNFNGKTYCGSFEILRRNSMNLSVVNCVDLETYVKGVIPYEMSPSWPIEALKAQALCARTYVAKHMNQYGEYGFDVTDDTHSQVYNGTQGATEDTSNPYSPY